MDGRGSRRIEAAVGVAAPRTHEDKDYRGAEARAEFIRRHKEMFGRPPSDLLLSKKFD